MDIVILKIVIFSILLVLVEKAGILFGFIPHIVQDYTIVGTLLAIILIIYRSIVTRFNFRDSAGATILVIITAITLLLCYTIIAPVL